MQMLCRVLRHFNTSSDEYSVVFASNCTAALKLVAESFQFIEPSRLSPNAACISETTTDSSDRRNTGDVEECPPKFPHEGKIFCLPSLDEDLSKTVCTDGRVAKHYDGGDKSLGQLADCCIWNSQPLLKPTFLYLDDNHTSVIGMRGVLADRGATFCCIPADSVDAFLSSLQPSDVKALPAMSMTQGSPLHAVNSAGDGVDIQSSSTGPGSRERPRYIFNSLFAYPAQSNFSGSRYPLEWADAVRRDSRTHPHRDNLTFPRWYVLVDAAALLTTSTMDLRQNKPDFVVLSFYKMFGFPTALGMTTLSLFC